MIRGFWDVPLVPPGSLQVQSRYHELRKLHSISTDFGCGPVVERRGLICRLKRESGLSQSPSSLFPDDSDFVIRTEALNEFIAVILDKPAHASTKIDEAIHTRTRRTLYKTIAAIAKAGEVDISKPSKTAELLESVAKEQLSFRLPASTVDDILNDVLHELKLKSYFP
jgi:chorismate mutase